jgi:glycosyltransferase involved in cell wall biosynthesis
LTVNHETLRFGLVCGALNRAGLERVVCNLAAGARRRGVPVTVFSFRGGPLADELRLSGVDVQVLACAPSRRRRYLDSAMIALRLTGLLRRKRINCANFHGLGVERIGRVVCGPGGVAVRSFVFHNNYPQLSISAPDQRYRKRVIRELAGFHHFIAISRQVRDWVVANGVVEQDRVTVIDNGIDLEQVRGRRPLADVRADLGIPEQAVVLIQVGRFTGQKNQDLSVEAFARVARRRTNLHLLFAGDGPLRAAAEAAAAACGAGDRVHFLGVRDDVPDLLGAADVFLLPSSWEGLPISLLEAFANGLPLVGTRVPGITDTVERCPGAAMLVPAGDSAALAQAMDDAAADEGWRAGAGAQAAACVWRDFSSDTMAERYLDQHRRLLSGRPAKGL